VFGREVESLACDVGHRFGNPIPSPLPPKKFTNTSRSATIWLKDCTEELLEQSTTYFRIFMHIKTFEIERFAIDKKLCARHFDSSKSDR
jgi:hypothetical protein